MVFVDGILVGNPFLGGIVLRITIQIIVISDAAHDNLNLFIGTLSLKRKIELSAVEGEGSTLEDQPLVEDSS